MNVFEFTNLIITLFFLTYYNMGKKPFTEILKNYNKTREHFIASFKKELSIIFDDIIVKEPRGHILLKDVLERTKKLGKIDEDIIIE